MTTGSRLRHSSDVALDDGLDRIRPAPDEGSRCTAKDCPYMGFWKARLRYAATFLCWHHQGELERLMKSQGKDFGQDGGRIGEARLWYASKKGYHSY